MKKPRTKNQSIQTLSLPALKRFLADIRLSISAKQSVLDDWNAEDGRLTKELSEMERELRKVQDENIRLMEIRENRKDFFGRLFRLKKIPDSVNFQIDLNRRSISELEHLILKMKLSIPRHGHLQRSLAADLAMEKRASSLVLARERKFNRIENLKIAAASSAKQLREGSTRLKKTLTKQEICPYCGKSLGQDTHLDHVYPVSKGGRSVSRNTVWCCSICNARKSNLTLMTFISKYGLDRDAIVMRLSMLEKDV